MSHGDLKRQIEELKRDTLLSQADIPDVPLTLEYFDTITLRI